MIIGFLQIDKQIRAEQRVVIKVLRSFPPKDLEVSKLSNNTISKLDLSCITNIEKIRGENTDNVIIFTYNINSRSSKFDDLISVILKF